MSPQAPGHSVALAFSGRNPKGGRACAAPSRAGTGNVHRHPGSLAGAPGCWRGPRCWRTAQALQDDGIREVAHLHMKW